jgi:hypothetical protein
MKYVQISEPIFRDLLAAKAKVNDIRELVEDYSFRPNAKEWKEYLKQIIYSTKYNTEVDDGKSV